MISDRFSSSTSSIIRISLCFSHTIFPPLVRGKNNLESKQKNDGMLSHCAAAEVNGPPEVECEGKLWHQGFPTPRNEKMSIFSEKMPQMGFLLHRDFWKNAGYTNMRHFFMFFCIFINKEKCPVVKKMPILFEKGIKNVQLATLFDTIGAENCLRKFRYNVGELKNRKIIFFPPVWVLFCRHAFSLRFRKKSKDNFGA